MLRFGYDLHVRAAGIPIPMYQIGNVLTLGTLGSTITTTARSVR